MTVDSFATLAEEIIHCNRCPRLRAWCTQVAAVKRRAYRDEDYWGRPAPGFGDPAARLLVVGLAPGAHGANRTGRFFTGDSSGDFLYAALHRAGFANQPHSRYVGDGLTLTDAYVTAVCRCAPPDNRPAPGEIATCLPYLEREIALLSQIQVVVALGRIAFDAIVRLCDAGAPVFAHGAAYPIRLRVGETETPAEGGRTWLVASYHPSRQNTQTGRLTAAMFDRVWETARLCRDDPGRSGNG
jgi:uracil-DNA glycosylase family 4